MTEKMTSAEYLKMVSSQKKTKSKYKNQFEVVDGIKFHSKKEAAYYGQCKIRKQSGELVSFEMQKRYKLEVNGILICTYVADFVLHIRGGGIQVIDVKSFFTRKLPEYRKKKKLMQAIHGIKIIEV